MEEIKNLGSSAFRYCMLGSVTALTGWLAAWALIYYFPQHVFLWCGVFGAFAIAAMMLFLISLFKFGQCLWQIWRQSRLQK